MFYNIIKNSHSGFRWIVLIMLMTIVVNSLIKWIKKSDFKKGDEKLTTFSAMAVHIQLLLGIILYFISPKVIFSAETMKNDILRFFTVEHSGMMLLAIIIITIGSISVKKATNSPVKFKRAFLYFGTGLLIILLMIPWPFEGFSTGWI
jgi:cytochrome b561